MEFVWQNKHLIVQVLIWPYSTYEIVGIVYVHQNMIALPNGLFFILAMTICLIEIITLTLNTNVQDAMIWYNRF